MKANYSKIIHAFALLCFLLPFFYTGCEEVKQSESPMDTLSVFTKDTLVIDSIISYPKDTTKSIVQSDTIYSNNTKESDNISQELSYQYPFLKPILIPKKDTFTGLAILIDTSFYIPLFATFVSFLLLLIGLVAKFIDAKAKVTILLLDLVSLLFLFIAEPNLWVTKNLWGYWLAIGFIIGLSVYDFYVIRFNKTRI